MSKHESVPRDPFRYVDPTFGPVSLDTRYECKDGLLVMSIAQTLRDAEHEAVSQCLPLDLDFHFDFLKIFLDLMRKGEVASDSFAKARREN